MTLRFRTLLTLALGLCLAARAPGAPQDADGGAPDLAEELESIEGHLAADATATALKEALAALEWYPEDPALLAVASRAAEAEGDKDRALWYAQLAREVLHEEEAAEQAAALDARIAALDTVAGEVAELVDRYDSFARKVYDLGRTSASRKLYVNAVDLLNRCRGTRFEHKALAELAELYADPNATSALIQSGIAVPPAPRSNEEIERIAALDAAHSEWEDAHRVESKNYLVITNMGYEMAQAISTAMEQMNLFYRDVFKVKGHVPPCEIRVYRSREEFDSHESVPSPSIQGFYVPGLNYVATYDHRTGGFSMEDLWRTLFHEASHQFTHMACEGLVPGWLNEGTASYFEGAALLPNKSVITNDIPSRRLMGAYQLIRGGAPSLFEVVSYHSPGSYDGSFYPIGWSLLYFLQNYENEKSERVYQKPYQNFLNAYRKTPKESAMELFEKHLIKGAKEKGVESFEDFEKRWSEWVVQLFEMRFRGRPAQWVERARTQEKNRKKDEALESYRFALLRDPNDFLALFESADAYDRARMKDQAAYNYRKILRQATAMDPETPLQDFDGKEVSWLVEESLKRLEKLNKVMADTTRESLFQLPEAALAAAEAYQEGGLPRQALRLLDDSVALLGDQPELLKLREEVATRSGVDTRRWRRLRVDPELQYWQTSGEWWASDEGLDVATRHTAFAMYRDTLPDRFTLEVRVRKGDREGAPLFGVIYTSDDFEGMRIFGVMDYEKLGIYKQEQGEIGVEDTLPRLPPNVDTEDLVLGVTVRDDRARCYLNGNPIAEVFAFRGGRIGLFVDALDYPTQGRTAEVEFLDLKVLY